METFEPLDPPENWAKDDLSNFLELAHRNGYATFVQRPQVFRAFREVDTLYRKAVGNLENSPEWFAGFFLLRSHAAFLAACRLSMSGHVPETYILLRGCLESAMYGFHISKNPELRETWLRRHDNATTMATVKTAFRIGSIFEGLTLADASVAKTTKSLYDRTIDYGAHPNERALSQVLKLTRGKGKVRFELQYLADGSDEAFKAALRSTAQIGAFVLEIFRLVFQTRFELLGIADDVKRLVARL